MRVFVASVLSPDDRAFDDSVVAALVAREEALRGMAIDARDVRLTHVAACREHAHARRPGVSRASRVAAGRPRSKI
jgi:hypothetical protein